MHKPILAVTGDTHGEEGRFLYPEELANKHLQKGDYLFICGDFGYLFDDSYRERQFLNTLHKMCRIPFVFVMEIMRILI